jgi:Coenzyme PQQ synthesis protein D (PqqD)
MNLTDKPTIPAQVMARQLGDETVILDLVSGTYFGLDPVGARIWQLISEEMALGEICEKMLEEYEVTGEALAQDVIDLADKLLEKKLIIIDH